VELSEESSSSCSSSLVVGLDLALDGLLDLLVNLELWQESVKDSVGEIKIEGQLLKTTKALEGRDSRGLGQSRELAAARVGSEVAGRVLDGRKDQSKLSKVLRLGDQGQLLKTTKALQRGESSLLGQSREPATAEVAGEVTSRVVGDRYREGGCWIVGNLARSSAPAVATGRSS
jgi:hypothetical protein